MTRNDTIASLAVNAWINGGRVDWPGANLHGADLTGCDLDRADMTECDLRGADLRGCYLNGVDLGWAKIDLGNRTFTLTEETAR